MVLVGDVRPGIGVDRSAEVHEVLDLLDAIDGDGNDRRWDLDQNGLIDIEDLRIMLDRFTIGE